MIKDRSLTANISLYELTQTNKRGYLALNRERGLYRIPKLTLVAQQGEHVRTAMGYPYRAHSGYRCDELNRVTIGSSWKSQHVKAEAGDCSPMTSRRRPATVEEVKEAFEKTLAYFKAHRIMFGQLIFEQKKDRFGKTVKAWIHHSLGAPFRPLWKCGQVLTMKNGLFFFREKISYPRWR